MVGRVVGWEKLVLVPLSFHVSLYFPCFKSNVLLFFFLFKSWTCICTDTVSFRHLQPWRQSFRIIKAPNIAVFSLFCLSQTSSIHGRHPSTSMKTATLPLPRIWRVYLAAALSYRSRQRTRAASLTASTPLTTCSMGRQSPASLTCSAQPKAARWTTTTAVRRVAPSTPSAWWCPSPWHQTTSPAALSHECTTARTTRARGMTAPRRTSPAAVLVVEGLEEAAEVVAVGAAVAKWTASQPTCWTSSRSSCQSTAMASTRSSTSARLPRLPASSATRAPGVSATWCTLYRNSSPSPIRWRARPRWTAPKGVILALPMAVTTTTMVTITTATGTTNTASGARARSASQATPPSTARAWPAGGAPMTTWIVTARTGRPASWAATTWTTSATATRSQCKAILATSHSRPPRATMTSSARPARAWPWHQRGSSWRGALGLRSPSARPRRLTGSPPLTWRNLWCRRTWSLPWGLVITCRWVFWFD